MIQYMIINKFNYNHTILKSAMHFQQLPSLPDPNDSPNQTSHLLDVLHASHRLIFEEIHFLKNQLSFALNFNQFLLRNSKKLSIQDSSSNQVNTDDLQKKNQNQNDEKHQESHVAYIRVQTKSFRRRRIMKRSQLKHTKSHNSSERNDTKNIPKNYGKAMLSFIYRNIAKFSPIIKQNQVDFSDLIAEIKKFKRKVNSINYLKEMWGYQDEKNGIKKCIRIFSYYFLRKHCLAYIFNSRVKNFGVHVKYRNRIIEGLEKPDKFTCIKEF